MKNASSILLILKNMIYIIQGYYNPDEIDFISDYYIRIGKEILSMQPQELKRNIINRLKGLSVFFEETF